MKLNEINIRDPFILPYRKKYYMYGSRVGRPTNGRWGDQTGFDVYISEDLENWSAPKSIFEKNNRFWGTEEFWAPEVHFYNRKFYMFASFKADGKCRATHILAAEKPDGLFAPVAEEAATPKSWECLDGTLYVDQKGLPHLVFCHECVQIGDGTICEVQLSQDLAKPVSEPNVLWHASDYPKIQNAAKGKTALVTDGPFLFRGKSGDLFCIWSTFNENGYCELISKSSNGDIDGTWSILDQPLSSDQGGHGMIFTDFFGNNRFIMHRPNTATDERPVIFNLRQEENRLYIET